METLLQNLLEQHRHLQLQPQQLHLHDEGNMENSNEREPPIPPRRKYVSIFSIDGEPILPPLMTTEKRRQMQKIKEKALKVEQRLRELRQRTNKTNNGNSEDTISQTSRSSICNTVGSMTQRSQDYYEANLLETEESLKLLQKLIERQHEVENPRDNPQESIETREYSQNYIKQEENEQELEENQEKLFKLQKSEIIIYDNSTNEIIQLPPANGGSKSLDEQRKYLREQERNSNINSIQPKKPTHLLLAGVDGKGMPSIPSICLNPPTPLVGNNRNICENLSNTYNEIFTEDLKSPNLTDDLSSDESFNSMLTHSDKISKRNLSNKSKQSSKRFVGKSSGLVERHNKKPFHKDMMNVSNKIQQFEALSSETNSPQTSPEKLYHPRKACLETSSAGTMNRSATSPSIKLTASNRSSSSKSQSFVAQDSDNSPDSSNLVRSSSFTLEGPSKALIDHLRQQKTIHENKTKAEASFLNKTRTITRKSIASPLRAHRDTVESKAKRVQKVELKTSKQKIQQKTSQNKLAQAAAASLSIYNSPSLGQQNNNNNNLYKTKKSPYDTLKTSQSQSLQKTSNLSNVRKSASSPSGAIQMQKSSKSRISPSPMQTSATSTTQNLRSHDNRIYAPERTELLSSKDFQLSQERKSGFSPTVTTAQNPKPIVAATLTSQQLRKSPTGKESYSQMDKIQKEKFLKLLAQQEEEHRRLQQSFEMQQKLLMEQLNQEMATIQIKSPNNSNKSSSPSSQNSKEHARHSQNHCELTNQLQHQLNLSGFSSDTKSNKSPVTYIEQPSPTISNDSSNRSITNAQSQSITAAHQSITEPISNLSSMDHSNANTSLDLSTLTNQTSPDSLCVTPINIQISSHHNTSGNKKSSSSSSRRRLFTTEVTPALGSSTARTLTSRSSASSSYPSINRLPEQFHEQKNLQNKSSMGLSHNGSNRRLNDDHTFVQHAAATKINACARGFLVRRLFQTEQIQRIVQTIHDTLIFVLNLHLETMDNPEESHTPANIKLKARLLQQLSSACRTLHLVFFQTTIKERMEIIARDRKRIKAKLLSMNRKRTPRIAG